MKAISLYMEFTKKKSNSKSVKALNGKTNTSIKKSNNKLKSRSVGQPKGGRTTISPPAKISQPPKSKIRVLASNIDTIKLSINIVWDDSGFFETLKEAKQSAKGKNGGSPITFYLSDVGDGYPDEYVFNIQEYGSQGYEWLLFNQEYSLLIGNWEKPKSRPSVLLGIKSETLWRKGYKEAIDFILDFLKTQNGELRKPKISRLDLCLDALFPSSLWKGNLLKYKVTRASSTKLYATHNILSGIVIGKGDLSVRMYDKPLEIQQQSKKDWMYDVWGIDSVPDGFKIIRTEFQLRREVMKQIGIHTLDILYERILNIWAYCTKEWLKFQNCPGKQSHQRETFPWWKEIQDGFRGMESGLPSIRFKASNADKDMLSQQMLGLLAAYAALELETTGQNLHTSLTIGKALESFHDHVIDNELSDTEFKERVKNKKAKYQRSDKKMMESLDLRKQLGLE